MFLVVSPFPFITALFDSLKGDTGWSAAIVMTLVGPLLAFITYVITYGPTQRLSKYYRITCRILAIMLVWYVAALVILQSHARAQQQNPERGTMMEYLP